MPILKDFRQTKKIILPSYQDSEVIIYNSLLASESDDAIEIRKSPSAKKMLEIIPKLIASWNFVDENQKPLPVNTENLNKMSEQDILFIVNEIKSFNESLKKNSETKQ